jgi:hypothetical protein
LNRRNAILDRMAGMILHNFRMTFSKRGTGETKRFAVSCHADADVVRFSLSNFFQVTDDYAAPFHFRNALRRVPDVCAGPGGAGLPSAFAVFARRRLP